MATESDRRAAARERAAEEAKCTGKEVSDGYGRLWLPPGPDGIPTFKPDYGARYRY